MKGLLILAWFLVCSVPGVPGGFSELHSMIAEVTGKELLFGYGFYGCHCGSGGQGMPKDPTDRCCRLHKFCYWVLKQDFCPVQTQPYEYRVTEGQVICEIESECSMRLCACDRELVYCLRKNLGSYNPDYQYYPKFHC